MFNGLQKLTDPTFNTGFVSIIVEGVSISLRIRKASQSKKSIVFTFHGAIDRTKRQVSSFVGQFLEYKELCHQIDIAAAGRPLYDKDRDYAAGICLDKNNSHKLYFSSNAINPFGISLKYDIVGGEDLRSSYDMFKLTLKDNFDVDGGFLFSGNSFGPYSMYSEGGLSLLLWLSGGYEGYKKYETNLNIKIIS
jgi:hypothetical protein